MKVLTRILLFLYALSIAAFTGLMTIVSIKPKLLIKVTDFMNANFYISITSKLITFGIFLLFFIFSIYFIFKSLRSAKKIRSISRNTDIGQIMISLSSIENLVTTSMKGTVGIKEIKASARKFGNGLFIVIKIGVYDDSNLPNFTEQIQRKVKTLIEDSTGILVKSVKLHVDKIHVDSKMKKVEKNIENEEIKEKFIVAPEEERSDG